MKKSPLGWIARRIRHRIPGILLMTAAQVGYALLAVLFALGTRNVIDCAVEGDTRLFWRACLLQGGIIAGILVCVGVFRHMKERLSADLERDWKRRLLHGLLHGEYARVSAWHSGELLNRLNNDVARVNDGVLSIVPSTAAMITRLAAAVAVLGSLDSRFTALIVLVGAALVVSTGLLRRHLKELNKQVSGHDGKVSSFLQEIMEKLLMVQSMGASQEVERRADHLLSDRYAVQRRRKNVSLMTNMGIDLMSYGAGFLALVWGAFRMLMGQMTFGSVTAVIQLVNQLQAPLVNLSGVLPKYAAMLASAERLMELDAIQGEPEPPADSPASLYQRMESINARQLSYSYDRERIFHCADCTVPKGTFVAVTGPSGTGKSTLLKLLLGVFRPESGDLYLNTAGDVVPINRSTRGMFAYVPQGNLLLSGTLRENLTIVKPQATEEELRQAVYVSAMEDFLDQLPMGLDTVLGESGLGLSEGQAQRLAIARAVLGGAPVLLLDECTSALDSDTEQKVLLRLKDLPERTCIVVTHRPAAVSLCDWQLEISDGKIHAYTPNTQ